jgi:hypothetical protein
VWLRFDEVYKAVEHFTDDLSRRAGIRGGMRGIQWRSAWAEAWAESIKRFDRDFAAYVRAMGA